MEKSEVIEMLQDPEIKKNILDSMKQMIDDATQLKVKFNLPEDAANYYQEKFKKEIEQKGINTNSAAYQRNLFQLKEGFEIFGILVDEKIPEIESLDFDKEYISRYLKQFVANL